MSKVIEATDNTFEEELNTDKLVLLDFYAEWCGPCRMISPLMTEMAEKYGDQLKVIKINVDQNSETASKYSVKSIPNLFLVKNGEKVESMLGLQNKFVLSGKIDAALSSDDEPVDEAEEPNESNDA